jgi:glycosyltransferase involved in cell wall biosynthesis
LPNPSISVVIPTHGGRFLSAAVESVRAQTVSDWELVIVDDSSKDGTAEVARRLATEDPRVRVVTNPRNTGIAAARNRGLASISVGSEYVAFLDHDDVWMPEALETLRAALLASAKASAAHGMASGIDALGATVPVPPERLRRRGILDGRLVEWPRGRATEFASICAPRRRTTTTSGSVSRAEARSPASIVRCSLTAATEARRRRDHRLRADRERHMSATR